MNINAGAIADYHVKLFYLFSCYFIIIIYILCMIIRTTCLKVL